jgi:UDP-glucose 6-dehydrogenase
MRPCKFETDDKRDEIAGQIADFIQSGKSVEHFDYLVKSDYVEKLERRPDGTLTGKCNNRLFER